MDLSREELRLLHDALSCAMGYTLGRVDPKSAKPSQRIARTIERMTDLRARVHATLATLRQKPKRTTTTFTRIRMSAKDARLLEAVQAASRPPSQSKGR